MSEFEQSFDQVINQSQSHTIDPVTVKKLMDDADLARGFGNSMCAAVPFKNCDSVVDGISIQLQNTWNDEVRTYSKKLADGTTEQIHVDWAYASEGDPRRLKVDVDMTPVGKPASHQSFEPKVLLRDGK
jgi:hypothetical protein